MIRGDEMIVAGRLRRLREQPHRGGLPTAFVPIRPRSTG